MRCAQVEGILHPPPFLNIMYNEVIYNIMYNEVSIIIILYNYMRCAQVEEILHPFYIFQIWSVIVWSATVARPLHDRCTTVARPLHDCFTTVSRPLPPSRPP